jgi:hypothetical protein
MKHEIIESKTYRRCSYDLIFDGNEYFLLRVTSRGIPEVMIVMFQKSLTRFSFFLIIARDYR